MRGKLKFSFLLILSVLLLGCTKSTKEIENRKEDTNDNITDISNETTIEIEDHISIVEFKKNDVDLNGYELKQTVKEDINNDVIEDTIELWTYSEGVFYSESGYIRILEGNTDEVLTNIKCGMGSYEIKSIADINGDKVKDICISCNGGGNAVSWSEIYEYKDKEYSMLIAIQQDDSPLEEVNTNLSIDEIIDLLYEKCNFNRDTVKLKVPKEGSASKELVDKIKDKYYYFFCSDCFDGVNYANRDYLIMVDKDTLQTYKYSSMGEITPFISD